MDWKQIKAEYIAGGTSYRKLAEKYDVSFGILRRVAEREKWTDLRTQVKQEADTKLVESIAKDNANHSVSIHDVADKLLEKIKEMIEQEDITTQAIKQLTSAIKDIKDIKGIKSETDLKEQEARIAVLRKQSMSEDSSANDVKVVISEDLEEYSE